MRGLTILVLCVVVIGLGCSQARQASDDADPRANVCALSNTAGNTCVERQSGRRVCHIYAGVMPNGKPFVFPHELLVPRGSVANPGSVIVWHLLDPRFVFTDDDGPLELKTNNQFENGKPTSNPDGDDDAGPAAGKSRYRIRFKNTVQGTHNYNIAFRQGGTQIKCDPRIVSDSN